MPKEPKKKNRDVMLMRRRHPGSKVDRRAARKQNLLKVEFMERLKELLDTGAYKEMNPGHVYLIGRLLHNLLQVTDMGTAWEREQISKSLPPPSRDLLRLQALPPPTKPIIDADFTLSRWRHILLFQNRNELLLRAFVDRLDLDKDRNLLGSTGHLILPCLVNADERTMLHLLLERGVNMEPKELEKSLLYSATEARNEEIVAMLMYYNVDPAGLPDKDPYIRMCHTRYPIFKSVDDRHYVIAEMLLDYTVDKWSTYPFDLLIALATVPTLELCRSVQIGQAEPLCPRLLEIPYEFCGAFTDMRFVEYFWEWLIWIPHECLDHFLTLLETDSKESLIQAFVPHYWYKYWNQYFYPYPNYVYRFLLNFGVLAEHKIGDNTLLELILDKVDRPLHTFLTKNILDHSNQIRAILNDIVLLLLSCNATLDDYSLYSLYSAGNINFGVLRFMEVDCRKRIRGFWRVDSRDFWHESGPPVLPKFYYSYRRFYYEFPYGKTITEILNDPKYVIPFTEAWFYVQLSAHPVAKLAARKWNDPELHQHLDALPDVPTLLELARDASRKYVEKAYKIKNNLQFYLAVKKLKIGDSLQKIVLYEKALYPTSPPPYATSHYMAIENLLKD